MKKIDKALEIFNDTNFIQVTDFDECIIGVAEGFNIEPILVYDRNKMIKKLMTRDHMTEADAVDFFEYNIIGSYFGEKTPLFLTKV